MFLSGFTTNEREKTDKLLFIERRKKKKKELKFQRNQNGLLYISGEGLKINAQMLEV